MTKILYNANDTKLYNYQKKLIDDTLKHIEQYQTCNVLIVSPTSTGKSFMAYQIAKKFKKILYIAHRTELLNQFLSYFDTDQNEVDCVNIASIHKIKKSYDIIFVDEAHRAAARTYFAFITKNKNTPFIGLTATPQRLDGKPLSSVFDIILQSPDVPTLQKNGYILPYKEYDVPESELPDLSDVSLDKNGDFDTTELETKVRNVVLYGNAYNEWVEKAHDRKTIIYCVSVKHSEEVCEFFEKKGVNVANVSSKTELVERQNIYDSFKKGDIQVMTNCMLYTEGIDIPDISCVIMMRPTNSVTLFLQQGGRGGRICIGKKDCIILDHANNINRLGSLNSARDWKYKINNKELSSDYGKSVPLDENDIGMNIIVLDSYILKERFLPDTEFFNIFTI